MFDPDKVRNAWNVYFYRTNSSCRLIYYEWKNGDLKKRLREISFSRKEINPLRCVLTFKKIAKECGESLEYEPSEVFHNGVYSYYKKAYKGYVTVLDMNSAYLWALSQPLADYSTKTECTFEDVKNMKYDYYSFENSIYRYMFCKEDYSAMIGASLWEEVKIYGYKSKVFFEKTSKEIYRLKCEVDKERYKNVANIAVGCMHKHSGKQNNATLAASLYALFEHKIKNIVDDFKQKGYHVIMVTTDSIKIAGKYRLEDDLVKIGDGLGEFKIEYEGEATYFSEGHYEESKVKWKGMPQYIIDGYKRCKFVENIEEEKEVYLKYAVT